MNTIEERVAYLEGRMEDHTAAAGDLRVSIREFRDETGRQFADVRGEMNREFADVRGEMNREFAGVRGEMSQRFADVHGEMNRQFADVRQEMNREFADVRGDMNRQFADVNRRFELIDQKVDRHFTWLVGLQVTSLLAVMSAIAGLYLQ